MSSYVGELEDQVADQFDEIVELKEKLEQAEKHIEEINSYIPNISTKALTTSQKLKIAIEALQFYADLDTGVKEKYKKASKALDKINEL